MISGAKVVGRLCRERTEQDSDVLCTDRSRILSSTHDARGPDSAVVFPGNLDTAGHFLCADASPRFSCKTVKSRGSSRMLPAPHARENECRIINHGLAMEYVVTFKTWSHISGLRPALTFAG